MALPPSCIPQVRTAWWLLAASLQAASWASAEGAATPRRVLTELRTRELLSVTGGSVLAGSGDGSTGAANGGGNLSSSGGILAGIFLCLALVATVGGCMLVRVCGGSSRAPPAPDAAAQPGGKADKAPETPIPVLTGQRIRQPDGTFVCAIASVPSGELDDGEAAGSCGPPCSRGCSHGGACCDGGCRLASKV